MVKLVDERITVGVPDIEPLPKIKPLGNAGSIAHADATSSVVNCSNVHVET